MKSAVLYSRILRHRARLYFRKGALSMKHVDVVWSAIKLTLSGALLAGLCGTSNAGAIFLTGHDPDFHAYLGGNLTGARDFNNVAIDYILDPGFNTFVSTAPKFLFVESSISPPSGHVNGVNGIIASGYASGVDFDFADSSTLNAALNSLGVAGGYSGLVIASDFGGVLGQAELDILDARSADIINFLNAGGGLYAMAESGAPYGLTSSGEFGFLPFIVSSAALNQSEIGNTLTSFGSSLGLLVTDINGNASHNIFTSTGGMNVVDNDSAGHILSLATRSQITSGGVVGSVPEPESAMLLLIGMGGLALTRTRKRGLN